jgi:hypothetical protein
MLERVIAYVDGFNLYFGLKEKGWRYYYWLNLKTLCEQFIFPGQRLLLTKYFTSRVNGDPAKSSRQGAFIQALKTIPNLEILKGRYGVRGYRCHKCAYEGQLPAEKMTDVCIASEMITDAFQNKYDTAFLISSDRDLVPAVGIIREVFPHRHIKVIFPPARRCEDLEKVANSIKHINKTHLRNSVFPDTITRVGLSPLVRPPSWV